MPDWDAKQTAALETIARAVERTALVYEFEALSRLYDQMNLDARKTPAGEQIFWRLGELGERLWKRRFVRRPFAPPH